MEALRFFILILALSVSFPPYAGAQQTPEQEDLKELSQQVGSLTAEVNKLTAAVAGEFGTLKERTLNTQKRVDDIEGNMWKLAIGVILAIVGAIGNYVLNASARRNGK